MDDQHQGPCDDIEKGISTFQCRSPAFQPGSVNPVGLEFVGGVTGELQTAPIEWAKASFCRSLAHGIGGHRGATAPGPARALRSSSGSRLRGVRGWLASRSRLPGGIKQLQGEQEGGHLGMAQRIALDREAIWPVGSAPSSGVTQEVLCPFLEGEQEQSEDDCLEADCAAPFIYYAP